MPDYPEPPGETTTNGIAIHATEARAARLKSILDRDAEFWQDDDGVVDLPVKQWMHLPLNPGWEHNKSRKKAILRVRQASRFKQDVLVNTAYAF